MILHIPDKQLLLLVASLLLSSCATVPAPVDSRDTDSAYRAAPVTDYYAPEPVDKGFHEVVRGDTLYSISWRYGLDYRDVARWNDISVPHMIRPGQRLRLTPNPNNNQLAVSPVRQDEAVTYPATGITRTAPAVEDAPVFVTVEPEDGEPVGQAGQEKWQTVISEPAQPIQTAPVHTPPVQNNPVSTEPPLTELAKVEPAIIPQTATRQGPIKWRWPTQGNLIRSNSPIAQKGLDISGKEGQDIMAAGDGVVVYSGSGLLGYGKLIIIKHDDTYLSAYAHNQVIHVKEGDSVSAGQKIGTMGRGNRGEPLLHFEIRKDGKTVDPIRYLPARS